MWNKGTNSTHSPCLQIGGDQIVNQHENNLKNMTHYTHHNYRVSQDSFSLVKIRAIYFLSTEEN